MTFSFIRLACIGVAACACVGVVRAAETSLDPGRGVRVRSDDSDLRWQIGGRVHIDSARFDGDSTLLDDETDVRRARIEFGARIGEDWRVAADYDVAGVVDGWKSVYAQYRGFDEVRLTFGSQLVPFSMDELTSSDDLSFLERALPNALSPGILTGASFQTVGRHYSLTGGVFGNSIDRDQRRDADGRSLALRFTTAPVRRDKVVLHLGIARELRDVDNGLVRFRARPETYLTTQRLVDTTTILAATDLTTTGFELGAKLGRLSLQAERIEAGVQRNGLADLAFEGDYAAVGLVLTGESVSYNRRNGTFGGVEPKHRWGALELVARTSRLDLTDRDVQGGIERNRTIGVNWYLGRRFRLMVDRIEIDAVPNRRGIEEHPSILQVRFQATL